ncbi:hypothetical protein HS141_06040 [Cetobacterium somerae]|uniref:hypothetical protein n=1 Tax=Cetobacterium somerae TaxID=188913 RepID=UPI00211F1861|nr:hypothetical protein [Cetobacterium somerae]MCQ9626531.1 hypothetical protein [Cetobacterium somerae]
MQNLISINNYKAGEIPARYKKVENGIFIHHEFFFDLYNVSIPANTNFNFITNINNFGFSNLDKFSLSIFVENTYVGICSSSGPVITLNLPVSKGAGGNGYCGIHARHTEYKSF